MEINYELELDDIIKKIKETNAKIVGLQLPDGLKMYAKEIVDYLKKNTDAEFVIWAGSNFGACDIADFKGVDLTVHFGHSEWR